MQNADPKRGMRVMMRLGPFVRSSLGVNVDVQMPFAVDNILTARVDLPRGTYPDSPASIRFFEQLLPKLQAVAGVEAATLSDGLPATGNGSIPVMIQGQAYPQASDYPLAREGIVTAGYFETFQTKVLSGRLFYKSMMLAEIAVEEAEHRLGTLIEYFRAAEAKGGTGRYRVPFTRQQLADMTGLRVETVVRSIKSMEHKGALEIEDGKIVWHGRDE